MAAHRYWRLYITAVNANQYVGVSEIELFDATYADVTTGLAAANVTHSSRLGSAYNGSNVIDDDFTTLWHTNGATVPSVANPEWVKIDLGAGNDKDVIALSIKGRITGEAYVPEQCPKDFKLQYSDDGATWSDLFSVTGQTGWGVIGERRFFNASGSTEMVPPPPPSAAVGTASKRFWRVRTTAVDGDLNAFGLQDIEFHTTVGGAQAATGGTAYAANTYSGLPSYAFDSGTTEWIGADTKEWIGYLFPAATEVVELKIKAGNTEPDQSPKDFVVEYLDGAGVFQTAHSVTGSSGWTSNEVRTFTVGSADVTRALTGVSAAVAVGTAAPSTTTALTGAAAAVAVGTVTAETGVVVALTGVTGTGAAGTVASSSTSNLALTGVAAAVAVGTAAPGTAVALSGVSAAGAVGSVTAAVIAMWALSENTTTGEYAVGGSTTIASSAMSCASGNPLLVWVAWGKTANATVSSVTDTAGNTYTASTQASAYHPANVNGNYERGQWWYCLNPTGHATNVVTATLSVAEQYRSIQVLEVAPPTGVTAALDFFDTTYFDGNAVSSNAITTDTITTTDVGFVAVGEVNRGQDAAASGSFSNSYTMLTRPTTDAGLSAAVGYKATSGVVSETTTFTGSGGNNTQRATGVLTLIDANMTALTGVLAPGQLGSVATSTTVALTGVSAAGAVGAITLGADLTGVAAGAAVGAVAVGVSPPLSQVTGTGAVGSVARGFEVALTGVAAAAAAGSASLAIERALTQVAGAGAAGSATIGWTPVITGVAADAVVTSPASGHTLAVTGNAAAGAVGSVQPPDSITGISAATAVGTMTPGAAAALSQAAGTGAVGTVVASVGPAITGVSAAAGVGTLAPVTSVGMTQVAAAAALGAFVQGSVVTGVASLGTIGTISPGATVQLTGVQGVGTVGRPATFAGAVGHPRISVVTRRDRHIFSSP